MSWDASHRLICLAASLNPTPHYHSVYLLQRPPFFSRLLLHLAIVLPISQLSSRLFLRRRARLVRIVMSPFGSSHVFIAPVTHDCSIVARSCLRPPTSLSCSVDVFARQMLLVKLIDSVRFSPPWS